MTRSFEQATTTAEIDEVMAVVDEIAGRWGHGSLPERLAGGEPLPPSLDMGEGTWRDLRDAMSMRYTRSFVAVYWPAPAEAAAAARWHDFGDEHGYPVDRHPGHPPQPPGRGDGRWVGLTWDAIRRRVAGRVQGDQLTLA